MRVIELQDLDTVIVDGARFSYEALKHLAQTDGELLRFKRDGDVVRVERVEEPDKTRDPHPGWRVIRSGKLLDGRDVVVIKSKMTGATKVAYPDGKWLDGIDPDNVR